MKKIGLRMLLTSMTLVGVSGGIVTVMSGCGKKSQGGELHPEYFDMIKEKNNIKRQSTDVSEDVTVGCWLGNEKAIVTGKAYRIAYDSGAEVYYPLFWFNGTGLVNKGDDLTDGFNVNKDKIVWGEIYNVIFSVVAWSAESSEIICNAEYDVKLSFVNEF